MTSDRELIQRYAHHGDETAFSTLYRRHGRMVKQVAHRHLLVKQDDEDVTQGVFLILARKAASLRRPEALAAWLHGTTYSLALQINRQRKRRQRREKDYAHMQATQDPTHTEVDQARLLAHVDKELQRLSPRQRQAIILRYFEEHSLEEAAGIAGCTATALTTRASAGMKKLRDRLRKLWPEMSIPAIIAGIQTPGQEHALTGPGPLSSTSPQASLHAETGISMLKQQACKSFAAKMALGSTLVGSSSFVLGWLMILGSTVFCTGCVHSVRPFYQEDQVVDPSALVGYWQSQNQLWAIQQKDGTQLRVDTYLLSDGDPGAGLIGSFDAHLFAYEEGHLGLDLHAVAIGELDKKLESHDNYRLRTHFFLEVDADGAGEGRLAFNTIDVKKIDALQSELEEDAQITVLTDQRLRILIDDTAQLQQYIKDHREKLLSKPMIFKTISKEDYLARIRSKEGATGF